MDFPGGRVDKNPPTNSEDTGSILVWEDSTCQQQKSLQIINAGEGVKKKEYLYTVGGNVICADSMENSMEFP